jgi:hypothetical protein
MTSNDNIITNFSNATVIDGTIKVNNNILFSDRKQLSEGVYSVVNQVAPIVNTANGKSGFVAIQNNNEYDIFYNGSRVRQVKPVSMKVDDIANKLLDQYSTQSGGAISIASKLTTGVKDVVTSDTLALSLSETDWNSAKQSGGAGKMTSTPNTDLELLNDLQKALGATSKLSESELSLDTAASSRDAYTSTPKTADLLNKLPEMLGGNRNETSSSALLLTETEVAQKGGSYSELKLGTHTPDTDMIGIGKMAKLAEKHKDKNLVSSISSISLGKSSQDVQSGGNYSDYSKYLQTPPTADLLNKLPGALRGMNSAGKNSTEMMFSEALSATNSIGSVRSNYVDIMLDN